MRKIAIFLISLMGVVCARASELITATMRKDRVHLIDEASLRRLQRLEEAGKLEVREEGEELTLVTGKDSKAERLFEGLRRKGLVNTRESGVGTSCIGSCIQP